MKDGNSLINQSVRALEASSKTSPTAAGQAERRQREAALVDAINQIFSLFRINYHNQYHAAFGDTGLLNQAKRLWKETLARYPDSLLLQGAKRVIEESEYLPSLHRMIKACEDSLETLGLPTVEAAYREAANAPSPKAAYAWSHPAVYHAGSNAGWYLLANGDSAESYPRFQAEYRMIIQRLIAGEEFTVERPPQLEQKPRTPLSKAENHTRARELAKSLADNGKN